MKKTPTEGRTVRPMLCKFAVGLLLVLVASLGLRLFSSHSPIYVDEGTYYQLAGSLTKGRLSTGSSFTEVYAEFGAGDVKTGVEPFFDHPALYSAILALVRLYAELDIWSTRLVNVVVFGLPSVILVALIVRKLVRRDDVALVVAATYGLLSPVTSQSMILLENGVTLFFLMAIYASILYLERNDLRWLVVAGALAGLATLCKLTGVAAILAVALIGLINRRSLRDFMIPGGTGVLVASAYPAYGLMLNRDLFLAIVGTQTGRQDYGWLLRTLFERSWGHDPSALDAFLLMGWTSTAYFLYKHGSRAALKNPVLLGLLSYVIVLAVLVRTAFYHFQIVYYPFLSIFLGVLLYDLISHAPGLGRARRLAPFLLVFVVLSVAISDYLTMVGWAEQDSEERQVAEWIARRVPPGSAVVSGPFGWALEFYTDLTPIWECDSPWAKYRVKEELGENRQVFLLKVSVFTCSETTRIYETETVGRYGEDVELLELRTYIVQLRLDKPTAGYGDFVRLTVTSSQPVVEFQVQFSMDRSNWVNLSGGTTNSEGFWDQEQPVDANWAKEPGVWFLRVETDIVRSQSVRLTILKSNR